jgi:hypothetical protein
VFVCVLCVCVCCEHVALGECNRSVVITRYYEVTHVYALHWTANELRVCFTRTAQHTLLLPCHGSNIFGRGFFFVSSIINSRTSCPIIAVYHSLTRGSSVNVTRYNLQGASSLLRLVYLIREMYCVVYGNESGGDNG